MKIGSANASNAGMQTRMSLGMDAATKSIQNQIAGAQKELQQLSANSELGAEEKMKKRQEINQRISDLNNQLRQHQMERRKPQQAEGFSMEDMLGTSKRVNGKSGNHQNGGLSQAGMNSVISAGLSLKQAQVQGGVTVKAEGRAGVLRAEIKQDGGDLEAKKKELEETEQIAMKAAASQMGTLSNVNKVIEETAEAEQDGGRTETIEKAHDVKDNSEEDTIPAVSEKKADVSVDIRL